MKRDIDGHYLRANHASDLPRTILALDTETTPTVEAEGTAQRFRLGWSAKCILSPRGRVTDEEWRHWDHPVPLLEYLEDCAPRDGTLWVFANNVYFDLQALGFFRDFTSRGWTLDFVYDSQSSYMLIIRRDRYTIKALSVSNYLPASTRELGELLGERKLDVDFSDVSDDELLIYCFRDTEIALDAMVKYIELVRSRDLGSFRLSRAAQSYAAFRHRYMRTRLFIHADSDVRELEELAYTGGRVEAYRVGEVSGGPFACYDVNSMYPFIMRNYRLPVKCVDYHAELSPADAAAVLAEYSMIAEVELETDEPLYAYRCQGRLIFPVGRFTAYLCTEGLRQALLRGHARRIVRAAFYTDAVIFREYIDAFYKMRCDAREKGDAVMDRMAKLLMNSLYGKLAQRRPVVVKDGPCKADDYYRLEAIDYETNENIITTRLFHREIVTIGEELAPSSIVSIPAHITEYGRMLLFDIQEKIGRDRVLYCDTDSVFVSDVVPGKLGYPVERSTLGALSKKWTSSSLTIHGAKDYETDADVVVKGIPEDAELVAPRTWTFTYWPGQRSHMQRRIDDRYVQRTITKTLNRPYGKGRVKDDGSVSPWKMPDFLESDDMSLLLS